MLLDLGKYKYTWNMEALELMSFSEQCRVVNYHPDLLVIAWYIVCFHSPAVRSECTAILFNWKTT